MNADTLAGRQALYYFHERAIQLSADVPKDFNAFLEAVRVTYFPRATIDPLLEGLGLGINSTGVSDSRVRSAMNALASQGGGKLPSRWTAFFDKIKNEAMNPGFLDMAAYVVRQSASDLVEGAQNVGNTLIHGRYVIYGAVLLGVVLMIRSFGAKAGAGIGKLAESGARAVDAATRRNG